MGLVHFRKRGDTVALLTALVVLLLSVASGCVIAGKAAARAGHPRRARGVRT